MLAVIWLRSFCAVSLRSKAPPPQTPPQRKKVTKSATLAENEEIEDEEGPAPDVPPSLLVEKRKTKKTRFLLVSV